MEFLFKILELLGLMKRKTVVLNVGHTEKRGGACSLTGVSEWHYNARLAALIVQFMGAKAKVVVMSQSSDYSRLPFEINALRPDLVVSLHANAFNGKASGSEVLYTARPDMAEALLAGIVRALGLPSRGIKKLKDGDRGFYLLENCEVPCFILEPFFIDHSKDFLKAQKNAQVLAQSLAEAIESILEGGAICLRPRRE